MNSAIEQFLTAAAIDSYARELDPAGNPEVAQSLSQLEVTDLFDGPVSDHDMAACCHSGLWLLHNHLHPSHDISQSVDTAEGSWWHAIMHRSEGDFSNSKYWYRHVGEHHLLDEVQSGFAPFAFVDQCESEYRKGTLSDAAQQTAFAEWKALFEYCQQNAG